MRKTLLLGAALLAACSQQNPDNQPSALQTFDTKEDSAAPGVDVTAAPGVAFNYRYAFRLPGNRIGQVQEAHAQACEKLGITKCRITGMRYRLVNQKDVQAMLALRLDPAVARAFGKQATEVVDKSDGMLVDQEITGEDVGSKISGANRTEAQLREELAKVEAELARPVPPVRSATPPPPVDRQSLLDRAKELRDQIRSLQVGRDEDKEALAGTPMVFNYGSGSVVPGFDVRSPLRDALQRSADNFMGGFAAILVIFITLLPWLVLIGLGVWVYRLIRQRGWVGARQDSGPDEASAPSAA
jgi:hypothetical protein